MIRDEEWIAREKELDEIDARIRSRFNEIRKINAEEIEVCDNFIKAVDNPDIRKDLEELKASLRETNASFEALLKEMNRK